VGAQEFSFPDKLALAWGHLRFGKACYLGRPLGDSVQRAVFWPELGLECGSPNGKGIYKMASKNLRKVPGFIKDKLRSIRVRNIRVGVVKKITAQQIRGGEFKNLRISWSKAGPAFSASVVPAAKTGRFSRTNVEGETIVRKDLPMITKSYTFETPNWGDSYNGYHDVTIDRDVYQRQFHAPRENEIEIELLGREKNGDYVFRFALNEVLNTSSRSFNKDLFFNLNMLQENIGAVDIFPSDATRDDYIRSIHVNWELLPPGEREENIRRITEGMRERTEEVRARILDRYGLLEKLKPEAFIQGHGGFARYFGAKFADDLVVFENMEYGNAIYAMFGEWREQSKKSRLELLGSGKEGDDFVRITHTAGWKGRLRQVIRDKRDKK
jgi:hypothetical protein